MLSFLFWPLFMNEFSGDTFILHNTLKWKTRKKNCIHLNWTKTMLKVVPILGTKRVFLRRQLFKILADTRYEERVEKWNLFFCQDKLLALMINCQSIDQLYVLDWTPSEIDQRQFHKPLFQISWNSVNLLLKEREKEMKCDDYNRTSQSYQPSFKLRPFK